MADRIRLVRNRIIASPTFRRWSARTPLIRHFANSHANELFRLTTGFVHTQVLAALVEMDILKQLADRPRSLAEIASSARVPPERLAPILSAGQALGLTHRMRDGSWTLGDHGVVVASDDGLTAMIRHHAMLYRDLRDMAVLARSDGGETRLSRYWAYAGDHGRPLGAGEVSEYSRLMAASQTMLADEILDAYPFHRHSTLLDVGGGEGAFLAQAGQRFPHLALQCFDLPAVTENARRRLGENSCMIDFVGGDFFNDDLPPADITTLVRILCDHSDVNALRLLRNIRRTMRSGDRLVIAEAMRAPGHGQQMAAAYFDLYFLAMGSGKCRTPDEIGNLLRSAGFSASRLRWSNTRLLAGVMVARP